jgi:hypothetical protein
MRTRYSCEPGKPLRELQRIIVRCIEAHFRSDALSVRSGQSVKIVFRRRREDILHTLQVVAAKKLLHLYAFAPKNWFKSTT